MFPLIIYFLDVTLLQSVLNPSSQQADKIYRLFDYFNITAGFMLLLVIFLVFYISIKYRRRSGDTDEPVQKTENTKLEAVMIGIPALLLGFFFYHTVNTMREVSPAVDSGRKVDVIIIGHQWWWEVQYPGNNVVTANEVHLPVGKNSLLEMSSADVIHDWWVPELGNKRELRPKIKNYIWLDINEQGMYYGAQHAWMRIKVIAEKQNEFTRWLKENAKNAQKPKDSLAIRAAESFQRNSCASCYRFKETEVNSNVWPDLTHLASRGVILTGLMDNNQDNLLNGSINHNK